MNSVINFFDDCCKIDENYACSTRDLYYYYLNEWNRGAEEKEDEAGFTIILVKEFNLGQCRRRILGRKNKTGMLEGIKCLIRPDINSDEYFKLNIPAKTTTLTNPNKNTT